MADEEYHGRELRRLEQKAASKGLAGSPTPAFDDLPAFLVKLRARQAPSKDVKEVRAVFRGSAFSPSLSTLARLSTGAYRALPSLSPSNVAGADPPQLLELAP